MARKTQKPDPDRLTVTLGPGQREALQRIADTNEMKLAFVVRYALKKFIEEMESGQLPLKFPSPSREP